MHGNTIKKTDAIKIRSMQQILAELEHAFQIHAAEGSRLGGVHLELTSDTVRECIDSIEPLIDRGESHTGTALVDPRLNPQQALDVVQAIASFV
jgi:3-deoxy-7-phosphoheptulonate synthase